MNGHDAGIVTEPRTVATVLDRSWHVWHVGTATTDDPCEPWAVGIREAGSPSWEWIAQCASLTMRARLISMATLQVRAS